MKWHPLTASSLTALSSLAKRIHLNYPEDDAVFSERLSLYPEGCFVLEPPAITGYIISHPWHYGEPPALNSLLETLPEQAKTYYIHDIALLPSASGKGAASEIVGIVEKHARETGFDNVSLVAVNDSTNFWQKHGFEVIFCKDLEDKLRSYDDAATFMVKQLVQ